MYDFFTRGKKYVVIWLNSICTTYDTNVPTPCGPGFPIRCYRQRLQQAIFSSPLAGMRAMPGRQKNGPRRGMEQLGSAALALDANVTMPLCFLASRPPSILA